MLYEYEINDNIPKEKMEDMLMRSKTLVRNYFNFFIC